MNKPVFLLVAAVVFVSGCSSIPGLDFGGGQLQSKYENDIVIIKDQSVFPQSVKANQQISLVTYIQNLGERTKIPVTVDLYDTCGVFKQAGIQVNCGKGDAPGTDCTDINLLPREVKEIKWTLKPDSELVKVPIPSCKLKVAVSYGYTTSSQTEVYFINSQEAQRQQEEGTFRQKTSTPQKSEGPLVAYIVPDNNVRQPIFADADTYYPVSLYVENKGSGFPSSDKEKQIRGSNIRIRIGESDFGYGEDSLKGCIIKAPSNDKEKAFDDKEVTLIGKKSPPYPCQLKVPPAVSKEKTERLDVTLKDYTYEFRKESSVTIEPVGYEAPATKPEAEPAGK